ncbi:MAG: hypothetical protein II629_05625, partial [Ruminococcus sp.]|nr:hypothetical protein [Ruminococcus sp.]
MRCQASNHPALRGLKNDKLLTKVSFLPKKLSMTKICLVPQMPFRYFEKDSKYLFFKQAKKPPAPVTIQAAFLFSSIE